MKRTAWILFLLLAGPLAAQRGTVSPGPGLFGDRHWRTPAAAEVNLPASGNAVGDARITLDPLTLWVWTGAAWEEISSEASGATGPAGGDLAGSYPNPTIGANAVALGTDTTGGYAGSASEGGPATAALTLASNGTNCSSGQYPLGVDAAGNVEDCASVPPTITTYAGSASAGGPATAALALAADGANCSAGSYPVGVDASGAAQGCTVLPAVVTAHSGLTGLSADDHGQYALLAGRSGGQTLTGGTSSGSLTLKGATAGGSFTFSGNVLTLPSSNSVNQITAANGLGLRIGSGNAGNGIGFYFDNGSAALLCDANTNGCVVKANSLLGWGNAGGGDANQLKLSSPTNGILSITDPATSGPGALRIVRHERTTMAIADNGAGGSAASGTLSPTSSYAEVSCADADGCTLVISETGIQAGQTLVLVVTSGSLTVADSAGITELAGAWTGGADDSLSLIYGSDRWRELARSNN